MSVSFLMKLQACNVIKKEAMTELFSREFREIFKNIFFTEHFWGTAFGIYIDHVGDVLLLYQDEETKKSEISNRLINDNQRSGKLLKLLCTFPQQKIGQFWADFPRVILPKLDSFKKFNLWSFPNYQYLRNRNGFRNVRVICRKSLKSLRFWKDHGPVQAREISKN